MNTNTNTQNESDRTIHTLTNELLEDLFNPSITTLDLCQIHRLTLPELAAILESESFTLAVDCTRRINTARQSLINSEAATLATARLHDLIKDRPQTPAHAETIRKAATKLHPRSQSHGTHFQPTNTHPHPSTIPNNSILPRSSGGGAERSEAEGVSFSSPVLTGEVPTQSAEGASPPAQPTPGGPIPPSPPPHE